MDKLTLTRQFGIQFGIFPWEDFQILAGKGGGETDTQFKVSKQNSILDLIDTYRILWKAVFDESRMYGLEGDLSYLSRSTLQYGVKKPK
ncbi:Ribosomal protein S12 [Melia azedarach]|nr:Ribosomal protein S12 [Melia azedarach]